MSIKKFYSVKFPRKRKQRSVIRVLHKALRRCARKIRPAAVVKRLMRGGFPDLTVYGYIKEHRNTSDALRLSTHIIGAYNCA